MKLIAIVNLIWVSSEHFDRQSGYVSECHEICTVPIERGAEGELC